MVDSITYISHSKTITLICIHLTGNGKYFVEKIYTHITVVTSLYYRTLSRFRFRTQWIWKFESNSRSSGNLAFQIPQDHEETLCGITRLTVKQMYVKYYIFTRCKNRIVLGKHQWSNCSPEIVEVKSLIRV